MPKHWIYVLAKRDLRIQAELWSDRGNFKGKSYEDVRARVDKAPSGKLRRVEPDDILYVYAHMRYDEDFQHPIGRVSGKNAYALALQLRDEGLTLDIRQVKVFACGSASVPLGGGQPFYRELYDAMHNAAVGFTRVQVCGYEGEVTPAGHGGHKTAGLTHLEQVGTISEADWNARQMRARDKRHCFPP